MPPQLLYSTVRTSPRLGHPDLRTKHGTMRALFLLAHIVSTCWIGFAGCFCCVYWASRRAEKAHLLNAPASAIAPTWQPNYSTQLWSPAAILSRETALPLRLARPTPAPPSGSRPSWHYTAGCATGACGSCAAAALPSSLRLSCTRPRRSCWPAPTGWLPKAALPEADRVVPFCSRPIATDP